MLKPAKREATGGWVASTMRLLPTAMVALLLTATVSGTAKDVSAEEPEAPASHWSFRPATRPSLPSVVLESWPRNGMDRFILSRLEENELGPAPEADRRTLIRRLYFDLTGLPPAPADVDQFIGDEDPAACENLVDRLLASPRYGERWARHWLDTVHFGETHGYDKDKLRPNAWPYRDYVIRALNEDKPYSRFVEEQLAGDVLHPNDPWATVALGFIAAGPWDFVGHVELPESKTDGLIARYNDRDDMLMTAMSTFQSLTVHCARCHDHKFDPIPQMDYYRLQAVFAGVDRADRAVDLDPEVGARRRELGVERQQAQERLKSLEADVARLTSPELERIGRRLAEVKEQLAALPKLEEKSPGNGYHSEIEPDPVREKWVQIELGAVLPIDEIRLIPARPTDFPDTPGFGFPLRFRIELAGEERFANPQVVANHTNDYPNPGHQPYSVATPGAAARLIRVTATKLWERTSDYVFALAELQAYVNGTNVALRSTVTALDSIESGRWGRKRLVDNYDSRRTLGTEGEPREETARRSALEAERAALEDERNRTRDNLIDAGTRASLDQTRKRLARLETDLNALPKPQLVYAAASRFAAQGSFLPPKGTRTVHFLTRGEVQRPGEVMSPGALTEFPGLGHSYECALPEEEGARRAALARWLTHPSNTLTRRSIVNRVWHYHFGRGLVETPNDFGRMGTPPSHPLLLDWLACWFQENGESLKKLHRLILTSATYRQTSMPPGSRPLPAAEQAEGWSQDSASNRFQRALEMDAENRLLWRMNRLRLDAESIRDSILAVSGKLDLTMGGPSVRQFFFKDDHSPLYDYTRFDVDSPESYRRSVYRLVVRSVTDPFMDTLDCPDPSVLAPKRTATITSLQALAMLNNAFVVRQAEHLAGRLRGMERETPGQVDAACRLALGRPANEDEKRRLAAYAEDHGLANLCRVLFNSSEFMFID